MGDGRMFTNRKQTPLKNLATDYWTGSLRLSLKFQDNICKENTKAEEQDESWERASADKGRQCRR